MTGPTRRDWAGIAAVVVVFGLFQAFRLIWMEPRSVGLACLHGGPSLVCSTLSGLAWVIHFYVIGGVALLCGIWAITRGSLLPAVLSVCLGVVGMIDYNISWGLLGAALGVWTWLRAAPDHDGANGTIVTGSQGPPL